MDLQKPDISIILPVYNVEKQLVKCLESISNQKFSGTFEIIAVEAFSTDSSLALLKSFQINEPRLKIIEHGVREKISTSRTTGINASAGEYILHVDSDDWLLPGALEKLYKICKETDADVVVFDYMTEDINGKISSVKHIKEKLITTDKLKVQHHFFGAGWYKIVKRAINMNLVYGEMGVNTSEDLLYSIEILLKAEKIYLLPECFYVYYSNTYSLSYITKSEQYLKDQIVILGQLQKIVLKYKANPQFTENLLNYFEKWIYLGIARFHFLQKEKLVESRKLVRELSQFPILTKLRIRRLELSAKCGLICLLEVAIRFGPIMSVGIIRRSFSKTGI